MPSWHFSNSIPGRPIAVGIYFLIGVIMLVVPITYTLTTMANNLKNIDTNQIVISVDKLIQNLGKIDKLNINIKNLTSTLRTLKFNELEEILISINQTLGDFTVNLNQLNLPINSQTTAPNTPQIPNQIRL